MTKIVAPNREYQGHVGPVEFIDGVAETDNESVIAYCRAAGYEVGGKTDVDEPPALRAPIPADPRETSNVQVGTALRDAAVDPKDTDYLPPINAGKPGDEGNPHGPNVVAPGIHGVGVLVPGPVGVVDKETGLVVSDTDEQAKRETEAAKRVLIDQEPVGVVVESLGEQVGQPGPTEQVIAEEKLTLNPDAGKDPGENGKPAGEPDDPAKTLDPQANIQPPRRSADKSEWVTYALSQGASVEEIESSTKGDLIDKYYKR